MSAGAPSTDVTTPEAATSPAAPTGRWIGPADRPLMGWLSTPATGGSSSGVLLLPAVGYPYWSTHRTLRVLAERLAAAGHLALRLDHDATGDSAGDQWEPGRVDAWRRGVAAGAAELRALGCRRLTVAGVRLGGTLALLEGAAVGADAVAAWAPVGSGRRYAREIRLLADPVPDDAAPSAAGSLVHAGTVFGGETLDALAALSPARIEAAPAPRVLVVGGTPEEALVDHLRGLGGEVEERVIAGGEQALEAPAEEATVPGPLVDALAGWIGPGDPVPEARPIAPRAEARLSWNGEELAETVTTLGAARLAAVITRRPGARPAGDRATLLFLNTGSESHVGPGRAWVEYARELALDGHTCIRADFRGWGESPDDGRAPGRPYDAHCEDDVVDLLRDLKAQGHDRVVPVGLCASAWVALRAVLREPAAGVVALNPQLYWQPGDPVEATMAETRARRTAEREREARGGRSGLWTALDLVGRRPWAARWLDDLRRAGVPVRMVFAAGDDGLEFLHNRVRRRFARTCRSGATAAVEVAGIDHSMHRVWLRGAMVETIRAELRRIPPAARSA